MKIPTKHELKLTRGGGCFLVDEVGLWGCAAKWGRIFTTGLMGLHRVSRMGSHICGILRVGKLKDSQLKSCYRVTIRSIMGRRMENGG